MAHRPNWGARMPEDGPGHHGSPSGDYRPLYAFVPIASSNCSLTSPSEQARAARP
jgi:hypothetical protein